MIINEQWEFSGIYGSLDCMHYRRQNCHVTLQGMYQDKGKKYSIILKAMVDQLLHIWHSYFGLLESNNDLNALDCSPWWQIF